MERKNIKIDAAEIEKQYGFMHKIRIINDDYCKRTGRQKQAVVQVFGCQQNEADGEYLAGMLEEMGYLVTDDVKSADLILVNTCAVREHAELKALSITGQFKHLKKNNPELLIGICGCMVSQEHRQSDIKFKYPYVDFLFGTDKTYRFPEILLDTINKDKRMLISVDTDNSFIAEGLPVRRESSFKAWVSIMYGCNNFCTYCVVPYVRGRERSREKAVILNEIKDLVSRGYKEFTLLGQNVNSYGKDLGSCEDFADLLNDICKIEGDFIVRFMTSHPKDATKKLIDTMADNKKIAHHFHLPLQAGNDRVLKTMNRRYTSESYLELVKYMREKMPDISISTDIIVGFPTETDDEFEDTLRMLKEVQFDFLYSFIYSPRKGTPAATYEEQVPPEVKSARFSRLLELQNEIIANKNKVFENKVLRVLAEGKSKTCEDMYTGRSEHNRIVHFPADDSVIGKFVDIKITRTETFNLFGEIV